MKILLIIAFFISFFSYSQKSNSKNENNKLVYKEIQKDDLINVKQDHTPSLAPNCKAKWDNEKKKKCLSKFISAHVNRNLNLDLARRENIKGIVKLEINFIIDKEGYPINITATGGPDIINKNAIDVINNLPRLEPAEMNGEPINVEYKMPVAFIVQ